MPYIKTVPPSEATGKLKEIYQSGGKLLLADISPGCRELGSRDVADDRKGLPHDQFVENPGTGRGENSSITVRRSDPFSSELIG